MNRTYSINGPQSTYFAENHVTAGQQISLRGGCALQCDAAHGQREDRGSSPALRYYRRSQLELREDKRIRETLIECAEYSNFIPHPLRDAYADALLAYYRATEKKDPDGGT